MSTEWTARGNPFSAGIPDLVKLLTWEKALKPTLSTTLKLCKVQVEEMNLASLLWGSLQMDPLFNQRRGCWTQSARRGSQNPRTSTMNPYNSRESPDAHLRLLLRSLQKCLAMSTVSPPCRFTLGRSSECLCWRSLHTNIHDHNLNEILNLYICATLALCPSTTACA